MVFLAIMGAKKSNTETNSFKLIQAKHLLVFFCLFILVYAAMMALWPVWGGIYVRCYRSGSSLIFDSTDSTCFVRFHMSKDSENEIKMSFHHRDRLDKHGRPATLLRISNDIHHGVYIYFAFIVALIAATPIPLKRKGWAMLWGVMLTHVFFVFRQTVLILYIFSSKPLSLLALSPFWKGVLLLHTQILTVNIAPGYIVIVFIWILVSWRREDWDRILMQKEGVSFRKT
jgi:hypothetical protein